MKGNSTSGNVTASSEEEEEGTNDDRPTVVQNDTQISDENNCDIREFKASEIITPASNTVDSQLLTEESSQPIEQSSP